MNKDITKLYLNLFLKQYSDEMSGADYERELKEILTKEGWLVFRVAGSFQCDLIALKLTDHMIIECKSVKGNTFYTSSDKDQFNILNNIAKLGFNVYYYIRWKGTKQWTKYQLPLEPYPVFKKGITNEK